MNASLPSSRLMSKLSGAAAFLAALCGMAGAVEIAAEYQAGIAGNPVAAPSPAAQQWTLVSPASDAANFTSEGISPDGASGLNAWRMLDRSTATSQFMYWVKQLTPQQLTDAAANGWRFLNHMRLADPVASNGGANSVYMYFGNNANKRWIIFFDINAAGQIVASPQGGTAITLTGVDASLYHTHEIVYSAAAQTADYLVDGVVKVSGWTGTTGTANGVRFGTESSGGRGDGYYNRVSFVINDPPPPPVPAVTAQPLSRSAAEGSSVTLTAAFSGSPATFQWFKDTVPVSGGTAAALTLSALTPADAGDYWCRATNISGSVSSATASLEILTASGGLVIHEFLTENDSSRDGDGEQSDWIELHNTSTVTQSTAGWFLTDDALVPAKWALPAESIAPGGFLLVWASGKDRAIAGGELHTNFSLNNNAGEYLALIKPDLTPATAFTYPRQYADDSFGLTVHQPGMAKYFAVTSPGALNRDGQTTVKDGLTFSPPPGTFATSVSVSIFADPLAPPSGQLRYTTDGTLPEFDSSALAETQNVISTASLNLRAALIYPGERYGPTATGAYLKLGADVATFTSPLPVMILSNHGEGAIPGVSARGPNGDGSAVTAVPMQAQNLLLLDEAAGDTALTSAAVNRSRAGLKLRGSSSFTFSEKSYSMETWGERDGEDRALSLAGLPADADWVIYGPDPAQFDNTLIHNTLTYALARVSGFNAPRFQFVELFLDNGGDLTMADHRGLAILMEKPGRGRERVDFNYLNNTGTAGGWMINIDRMDAMTAATPVPRHFHTAGPDGILQTSDDNPRGYQAILTPGGTGSGSGITPANDDMPNFYHSFFNFESPAPEYLNTAQRTTIQGGLRAFDTALYSPAYTDPVAGYWPHIDVPNWAHHLLIHCLAKNQDAVVLSSYLHRESPAAPIRWSTVWDIDRSYDRNTSGGSTGGSALTWAHDRLYYRRLVTDPEFMQAYVDKWQNLRRSVWTNDALAALIDSQVAGITSTVAARSGLTASGWAANITTMKSWLTTRANAMDALYTAPPVLSHPGGSVPAGFSLSITAPAGMIYYTTDGSDPRRRGGAVAGTASAYSAPLTVAVPTTVTVRVLSGSAWSGLCSAVYFPPQDLTALQVTEIYYNPPGLSAPFVDGEEFEFLELKNTGSTVLDVSGLSFTSGITFSFPPGTSIAPGAHFLLVRNIAQFNVRFPGCIPNGVFSDKLSNGGESLTLAEGGNVIWTFAYDDTPPWRAEADGNGMSLQRPYPAAPGYDVLTWTAAAPTPCTDLSLADSDADGLPDFWEALYGPTAGNEDADQDGATNAEEYLAATDYTDPGSRLTLTQNPAPAGQVSFEFIAQAGRAYTAQHSSDLVTWQTLENVPAAAATRTVSFIDAMTPTRRYYRAVLVAQ